MTEGNNCQGEGARHDFELVDDRELLVKIERELRADWKEHVVARLPDDATLCGAQRCRDCGMIGFLSWTTPTGPVLGPLMRYTNN